VSFCFSQNIQLDYKNNYTYKINGKLYDTQKKKQHKKISLELKKVKDFIPALEKNKTSNYKALYVLYKNYIQINMDLNSRRSHLNAFGIQKKLIVLIINNKKLPRSLLIPEYTNLASLYLHLKMFPKYLEALKYQKEALRIARKIKGTPLQNLSYAYYNMSSIYQEFAYNEEVKKKKNYKRNKRNYLYKALHNQNKAKNIDEATLPKYDYSLALNYQHLANIYKELATKKDLVKSKFYIEKSLNIFNKILPKKDKVYVDARVFLYRLNKTIKVTN